MIENKVMTARVSAVDSFRRWEHEADEEWSDFLANLEAPPNPKMLAGTAFHKALEVAGAGEYLALEMDGYVFDFSEFDGELPLCQIKEIRSSKDYGDLTITGKCDGISGRTITDYKLTFGSFDAEKYFESYQWRFYLDIFQANSFVYHVFEAYENIHAGTLEIKKMHPLMLSRYPEMESDCQQLATRFYEVALRWPFICKMRDLEEIA